MAPATAPAETPLWGRGRERALLIAILVLAAFLRLWRLDLMEFKADEAQACRTALQVVDVVRGHAAANLSLPLVGLRASVGIPNPPLFIYLLALPLFLAASPVLAAGAIALSNVVAVWLCYRIGRRYFSRFVGLAAAALYALAPWAVLFSRKIWAQDLLPIFIGGFLLAAHAFLIDRRPRALFWLLVLAAAAVQLHFSALILGGVLAGLLIAGRAAVRVRPLALGAALGLFLYVPYFVHILGTHGADFAHLDSRRDVWDQLVPTGQRLRWAFRYPLSITNGDGMADVIGAQAGWVWPFALATGLGACAGLIGLCRRDRASAFASARLMLAAWFVLPTLALVVTGVVPFIHYFIILFPLAFLGLAAALEWFAARGRYAGLTLLALILGGYAWQDAAIFRTIAQRGGAPGDYGVAYAYKAAAMRYAAAANAGQRPILFDGSHPGTPLTPEYRFLVDLALREGAGSAGGAAAPRGFVLLDLSKSAMTPAGEAATRSLARRQFGPLTLFELPLAAPPPGS